MNILEDFFFIGVLRTFDHLLTREEDYVFKRIIYSPIVDDPYEIHYESQSGHSTGVTFLFHRFPAKNISIISITISQPKSKILNAFGIRYSGSGYNERRRFSIEEFIIKKKMQNFFKTQILNRENIEHLLLGSRNVMQQYLLPVLRGEKWIDEILAESNKKNK